VMVLDNSRLHRNAEIVKFVEETDRLEIVFLPACAPELNPAAQARQVLV
jgi:transposase